MTGKLRIGGKLSAAFAVLTVLTMLVGAFSLVRMAKMNDTAHHLALRAAPAVQFTSAMRFDMSGYRRSELAHIVSTDEIGSNKEAGYAKYEKLLNNYQTDLVQKRSAFERLIDSEQERRLLDDFNREWDIYLDQSKMVIAKSRAGQQAEAATLIQGQTRIQFGRAEDAIGKVIVRQTEKAKKAAENCDGVYTSARNWLLLIILAFLGISVTLAYRISRGITEPLYRLMRVAREIGESGNLEHDIEIHGEDEIGDLARSFASMVAYLKEMAHHSEAIAGGDLSTHVAPRSHNDTLGNAFVHMTQGLASLVRSVRNSASQVASGSGQVAVASEQSARVGVQASAAIDEVSSTMNQISVNTHSVVKNAQMQASSVSETSTAIDQMVASIQHIADNSKVLLELSNRSRQETQNGIATMGKATDGLNRINTSIQSSAGIIDALGQRADDIGKIVEVIDDLADQTNLLALNAAIEAARAGENGLGFAVVADEVRKLAEKSALSTKEISGLIQNIQKEAHKAVENMEKSTSIVNEGLALGDDLGAALKKISDVVTEVYSFAQEIGLATDEQSHGSSQIAHATSRLNEITLDISASVEEQATGTAAIVKAMERMRQLIQQNTSGSHELSVSAEQMQKMSRLLLDTMQPFKLDVFNDAHVEERVTPRRAAAAAGRA